MNTEDFFDRRAGDKMLRAYNVGYMIPYIDYEPRTIEKIVGGMKGFIMSRSYKHTPVFKVGGKTKYAKR